MRGKLSKLHKKDTILHVMITFSLKQGQTRALSRPITLPIRNVAYKLICHLATSLCMIHYLKKHLRYMRFMYPYLFIQSKDGVIIVMQHTMLVLVQHFGLYLNKSNNFVMTFSANSKYNRVLEFYWICYLSLWCMTCIWLQNVFSIIGWNESLFGRGYP